MKKIEVKLSLEVVAPLLDVMKSAADALRTRLAVPMKDVDEELREAWSEELLATQNDNLQSLLALFGREFFENGVIAFDEENAEAILRACSALRLQLREDHLQAFGDETLESGDVELEEIAEPLRSIFMCYVFLATIQELIIQHLDSEILEN